jgi:hypothetical protein
LADFGKTSFSTATGISTSLPHLFAFFRVNECKRDVAVEKLFFSKIAKTDLRQDDL